MPLLELRQVSKRFGGIQALSRVSFAVEQGEILGLIGPNGAGKSTIFNLATGVYPVSAGEIRFAEDRVDGQKPSRVCALGMARTFQKIRIFKEMTVAENVAVGRHSRMRAGLLASLIPPRWARQEEEEAHQAAAELLQLFGLQARAEDEARNLSHGEQRLLEMARALATKPKLILLDEPAAGLSTADSHALMDKIGGIRADGVTVVIIEHDMEVVMGLCERIVVLNYGEKIFDGPPDAAQRDPTVVAAYLGGEAA